MGPGNLVENTVARETKQKHLMIMEIILGVISLS